MYNVTTSIHTQSSPRLETNIVLRLTIIRIPMPIPFQPPARDSASNFGTPRTSPRQATASTASNFMKELGKVNEQNAAISLKLVKENKRKQILDEELEVWDIFALKFAVSMAHHHIFFLSVIHTKVEDVKSSDRQRQLYSRGQPSNE